MDKEKPSNVINFPRLDFKAPRTAEEVKENLQMYKESYANDLAEIIWENVLSEMARAGCDFDEDINKYFPNMILIFEAIKALHLQTLGAPHPYKNLHCRMWLYLRQMKMEQRLEALKVHY